MPQDAEVPELILDAWNRRDLEGMLALADPEVEYVNAPDALEPGTRHGHDGLTLVVNAQWEAMPGMRQEIDRIHARGEEFFVEARISRQMPGSSALVENRVLLSIKVREGKVVRFAVLGAGSEFDAARDAAGLND
jgi:ketosteroid isomerase-like protein